LTGSGSEPPKAAQVSQKKLVLFLRGNAKDSGTGLVVVPEPGLAVLRIVSGLIVRLCEYFSKRNAKKYPRRLSM
jgi:hypothetical protein